MSTVDDPQPDEQSGPGRMSLRIQTLLFAGGGMLLALLAFWLITSELVTRSFSDLQRDILQKHLRTATLLVDKQFESLMLMVRNYAEWTDARNFVDGTNPTFMDANFSPEMNISGQDIVLVYDPTKKLIGHKTPMLKSNPNQFPDGFDPAKLKITEILGQKMGTGFLIAGDDAYFIASCPIMSSDWTSGPNGWMVFASRIRSDLIDQIQQSTGAECKLLLNGKTEKADKGTDWMAWRSPHTGVITARSFGDLGTSSHRSLVLIPSIEGDRPVILVFNFPELVFQLALKVRDQVVALTMLIALVLLFVSLGAFEILVLQRLSRLNLGMQRIAEKPESENLISTSGNDEITDLSRSANRMIHSILSERRSTEEQRSLLRSVVDTATEGIIALEPIRNSAGLVVDFKIVLVNASAAEIGNHDPSDLIGLSFLEVYPGNRRSDIFGTYLQVLDSRQARVYERKYDHDGISGWFRDSISPWGDGIVITIEDISDRKQREEELRNTLEEMERMNSAMFGREQRILELKSDINDLAEELGKGRIYKTDSRV